MEDSYDALDRATLTTWRLSNVLGWSAVALLAALVMHQVADELVHRLRISGVIAGLNARPSFGATWQFWAPQYGFKAGVSIAIGVLIGTIAGLKVWKRSPSVAAAVAGGYVLLSWLVLEVSARRIETASGMTAGVPRHGFASGGREWSYSALALIVLVVAPLSARFVANRRSPREVSPRTRG